MFVLVLLEIIPLDLCPDLCHCWMGSEPPVSAVVSMYYFAECTRGLCQWLPSGCFIESCAHSNALLVTWTKNKLYIDSNNKQIGICVFDFHILTFFILPLFYL